jgi:hypothetical protein
MYHKIYLLSLGLSIVVGVNGLLPVAIADRSVALTVIDRYPHKMLNLAATQKKSYSLSRFSIGGVVVEMSPAQVIKKFGKPLSIKEFTGCVSTTTLKYKRTNVSIDSANWSISTTDPRYRTDQGVRVGDSISKARRIYNLLISPVPNQKPGILEYTETGKQNLQIDLRFGHQNGRINRIEYAHFYNEDC